MLRHCLLLVPHPLVSTTKHVFGVARGPYCSKVYRPDGHPVMDFGVLACSVMTIELVRLARSTKNRNPSISSGKIESNDRNDKIF